MGNLYISNPMLVTAIRWEGNNAPEVAGFLQEVSTFDYMDDEELWVVGCPGGEMVAHVGNWIVKNSVGSFFVVSDELFRSGFTPVDTVIPK